MKKSNVLFKNEVNLEDSRVMRLEYNITENRLANSEKSYYGIQIVKYLDGNLEMEEVEGISYSREKVETITRILFQNLVTPISMIEIIDDLITQEAV